MKNSISNQLEKIQQLHGDIIIDVAGKDSYAALIKHLETEKQNSLKIIPIVVKAPSEYGTIEKLVESFDNFKFKISQQFDVVFNDTLIIEEYLLWRLLNGKYISEFIKDLGFYSPCPGCHIYLHSVRAYISKLLGINTIISGERLTHGSKLKINQLPISIANHSEILKEFGVNHIQPVLDIANTKEIDKLIDNYIDNKSIYHFDCVFSSNYRYLDGSVNNPHNLDEYYTILSKIALKYFSVINQTQAEIEKEIDLLIKPRC